MSIRSISRPVRFASLGLVFVAQFSFAHYTVESYVVSDVLSNVDGGIESGTTALVDMGLVFETDFNSFFGDNDANFLAYFIWNNGSTFSDRYVGDLQSVSSIDSDAALRLYEVWYEQDIGRYLNLRFGLYDLNSEFDATETSSFFVNGSHGIGAEYGQTGQAGPSIFPFTSLTLRLEWTFRESHVLRYAVLDAIPGHPDDPNKTAIHLSSDEGVLHALEYDFVSSSGAHFGVGAWLYSEDFELVDSARAGERAGGNSGMYAFVDSPVASWSSGTKLNAFFRYGVADDRFNTIEEYIGAGLVFTGFAESRPDDRFGIAVASGHIGSPWRGSNGEFAEGHETAIELTYSTQLTDWLRIQPDLQYVINPGADPALDDALVIGVRFELSNVFESD